MTCLGRTSKQGDHGPGRSPLGTAALRALEGSSSLGPSRRILPISVYIYAQGGQRHQERCMGQGAPGPQGAKQPQDADGGRGSCCCRGKVGAPRSGGAELSSSREEGGPRPAAPRGSQKNLGTVNTFKPSPSGAQKGGASQAGGVLASPEEEEASWRHVLS